MTMDWQGAPSSPSSYTMKRILLLEIPVDTYPNFNFVGWLLGLRGNSLKRVEAIIGCCVYIRGKGSIKDLKKAKTCRFSCLESGHFWQKCQMLEPYSTHLSQALLFRIKIRKTS